MMPAKASVPFLALLIAGCSGSPNDNFPAPGNEALAPVNRTAPAPANATSGSAATASAGGDSLAGYAGKYPNDEVDGETFLGDVRVRAAVAAAVPDAAIRGRILADDGTTTPIQLRNGRLLSGGCEAHNCGDRNWTILIDANVDNIEVCYHDAETTGGQSRWYRADRAPEMRGGGCPSE